jgi:AraC-like DNA-binding protein
MLAPAPRDQPAVARAAFLRILAGLRVLDVDVVPVLHRLGMGVGDLEHLPERLSPTALRDLWEAVTEATNVRGFGVRIADLVQLDEFARFGDIVATSATLGDALMRGLRLGRLISETVSLSAELGTRRVVLTLQVLHKGKLHPESVEFLLGTIVTFGRRITGMDADPLEVRLAHERPRDPSLIQQFFGCPVIFGAGENAIVLDSAALLTPVILHDPERCAELQREAEALLADLVQPGAFRSDVVTAISREISDGDPSIERVAARLSLHPKTLGRRLRTDGVTYRQLLDEVRFRLARSYLEQPELTVTEIAFRLAYSDKRAFNRAFRRWTGRAPDPYRRG